MSIIKNQKKLLKIVNFLMAIDFLIVVSTALLHDFIWPLGIYKQVHAIPGFILLILVISHISLNKEWVKNTYFKH